jgi:hypothetical protein
LGGYESLIFVTILKIEFGAARAHPAKMKSWETANYF